MFFREALERRQEFEGAGVGPVQVFHDEYRGPQLSPLDQQFTDILEDQLFQGLALDAHNSLGVPIP